VKQVEKKGEKKGKMEALAQQHDSHRGAAPAMTGPQALALELGFGAVVLLLCQLAPAGIRPALFWGAGTSLAAGLTSLPAVLFGARAGTLGLFGGVVAGFLVRLVFVASGLLASGARGRDALPYVFAFFALFAATVGVEIAFVLKHAPAQGSHAPGSRAPTP
jgi:hypothetical protein